jgi:CheY-like chemotaxis protein
LPRAADKPLLRRRILVVDDQPSIRGVLELALSAAGAEVWGAADGPMALASLESARPELILLDIAMPDMNGWQVLDRLRSLSTTAQIPVVIQTSAEDHASFERARRQGVAAWVSKPFRLGDVVETCRRILDGARPLQGQDGRAEERGDGVQVRDPQGRLLAVGRLLDRDGRGAQVELEGVLSVSQRVVLTVRGQQGPLQLEAEVRWVRPAGGRFEHGFSFLPAPPA